MIIQVIQHVPFEDPGHIISICERAGYRMKYCRLFLNERLPDAEDYDMLLVTGGPMSIHDEVQYPWLTGEKQVISEAMARGKLVFGLCLGAQLIASALGAEVIKAPHREIGWFPVKKEATNDQLGFLPDYLTVFHWHGETFTLPENAVRLYSSEATPNQAFIYGENVLALQFHPEITSTGAQNLVKHCGEEITGGPFIMNEEKLLDDHQLFHRGGFRMIESIFRYFIPRDARG